MKSLTSPHVVDACAGRVHDQGSVACVGTEGGGGERPSGAENDPDALGKVHIPGDGRAGGACPGRTKTRLSRSSSPSSASGDGPGEWAAAGARADSEVGGGSEGEMEETLGGRDAELAMDLGPISAEVFPCVFLHIDFIRIACKRERKHARTHTHTHTHVHAHCDSTLRSCGPSACGECCWRPCRRNGTLSSSSAGDCDAFCLQPVRTGRSRCSCSCLHLRAPYMIGCVQHVWICRRTTPTRTHKCRRRMMLTRARR